LIASYTPCRRTKALLPENTWRNLTVEKEQIENEIDALEKKIETLRASKPAHDVTGVHTMELLELEDELQSKKKRLQETKA
jgi:hypothetical protein